MQAVLIHGLCWPQVVAGCCCALRAVCGVDDKAAVVIVHVCVLLQALLVVRCCIQACC
jgi:hypothetical protein